MSDQGQKRGPYRSRQETEQLLLESGLKLLEEGSGSCAYSLVTAKDVAEGAGVSTGAIYSRWDTLEDFHHDLLIYRLELAEDPSPIDFLELFADTNEDTAKRGQIMRTIGPLELEHQRTHPAWGPVLVAWIMRADKVIHEAVQSRYRSKRDASDELVQQSLAYTGRKLRNGLTERDLAVAMTALVDGLVLRSLVDPEIVDAPIKWPPEAKTPIDWSLVAVGGDCLLSYFTEPVEGEDLRKYWHISAT